MHILNFSINSLMVASLIVSNSMLATTGRSIEVNNETGQPLAFAASAKDGFRLEHVVPEYTRMVAVIKLTNVSKAQEMLLEAILNNSAHGVARAVQAGADVNLEINGQKPLFWAMSLTKADAVRCLLNHGASC
jgi:ankyrin repeat protein